MQQMLVIVSLGLLASVAARPAVDPALFPAGSPFGFYPGSAAPFAAYAGAPFAAAPLINPLGGSPLAVSSSQRLDYFNQFNAAFAPTPPARILAAAPFPSAGARLIQPTRFIAPGVPAPYFF
ncbi:translation initiation factor IF-2 [Drosophila rhopaloa]|uniref:Translation initiation factor IF-2 n=1 Tax=Drosophila rhopaloa TaxID=1041015 RepID=A0A6P4EHD3_DRORH|nr:translation initiation factor IF-2 [Drosophila rhopaloa]